MTDIVSKETRSRMMAGIKGKDTRLELLLRRALHRQGFRFRLHGKGLPGRPDIVLPRHGAIVQANGCFWHGHDCSLFKVPSTNRERWIEKIEGNRKRDDRNRQALIAAGWRVLDVWECSVKGPGRLELEDVLWAVCNWVREGSGSGDIRGVQEVQQSSVEHQPLTPHAIDADLMFGN